MTNNNQNNYLGFEGGVDQVLHVVQGHHGAHGDQWDQEGWAPHERRMRKFDQSYYS